jgi:hypothetical protein
MVGGGRGGESVQMIELLFYLVPVRRLYDTASVKLR